MSRRLRTDAVQHLLDTSERRFRSSQQEMPIVFMIDCKVLRTSPHCIDPDATCCVSWSHIMGGKANGYGLHMLMAGDSTAIAQHH